MSPLPLLFGAGLVAGALNAVAGGGSFITFPALLHAGLPSLAANASSTIALLPGSLAGAWASRDRVAGFGGVSLCALLVTSFVGGLAGAFLLLATPQATFSAVLPWLLLAATLAFAFGRRAGDLLRRGRRVRPAVLLSAQFVLAVYGGYFGGAIGIMMMAVWSLLGPVEVKTLNPTKMLVVVATNGAAVACFAATGDVRWPETLAVMLGAVAGGYAGAHVAGRLPARHLQRGVTLFSVVLTAVFFARSY